MQGREIAVEGAHIYARETRPGLWVVSFYPDREDHSAWPGWIADSSEETIPTGDGLDGVLEWACAEWRRREQGREQAG
jgi:hypothetical protein